MELFQPLPIWPIILYYTLSIAIFALLFTIKTKINNKNYYWFFVFYTFFVVGVAAIQFCILMHGTSFMKGFLHINLDVDRYDSIRWGAGFFALISYFAMPQNKYVKVAK